MSNGPNRVARDGTPATREALDDLLFASALDLCGAATRLRDAKALGIASAILNRIADPLLRSALVLVLRAVGRQLRH